MILANIMVGFSVMLACLIVQAAVAFWAIRHYVRQSSKAATHQGFFASIRPLVVCMLAMLVGNFFQITLWGVLFLVLGEFKELYEAVYHSAVNFSSLGYGDFVMSKNRKLLGPLEAINGIIMLGMTSAVLVVIFQQLIRAQLSPIIAPAAPSMPKPDNSRDGAITPRLPS